MLQDYSNDSSIQENDYPKKGTLLIVVLLLHAFHLRDILQKQVYFHKLLFNVWVLFYRWENKVIRHYSICANPWKMPLNAFPTAFLTYICQLDDFTELSSVRQHGRRIKLQI